MSLCVQLVKRQLEDLLSDRRADPFDIAFLRYILDGEHPRLLAQDYMDALCTMSHGSTKRDFAKYLQWPLESAADLGPAGTIPKK